MPTHVACLSEKSPPPYAATAPAYGTSPRSSTDTLAKPTEQQHSFECVVTVFDSNEGSFCAPPPSPIKPALRLAKKVASAPANLLLTPTAQGAKGAVHGGWRGLKFGLVVPYVACTNLLAYPKLHEYRSTTRRLCEEGAKSVIRVPLMTVTVLTGAVLGCAVGASKGALLGVCSGLAEGYRATRDAA